MKIISKGRKKNITNYLSNWENTSPFIQKFNLINALSLNEIVSKHLELFPERFILDLDIEGDDFSVLEKFVQTGVFRPIVILIEDHFEFGLHESPITRLLEDSNYALVGRTVITSIFVDLSSDLSVSQFGI